MSAGYSRKTKIKTWKTPLLYMVFATIYIFISDQIVFALQEHATNMLYVHIGKALLFTFVTSTFLWFIIRRDYENLVNSHAKLAEKEKHLQESLDLYRCLVELSPDLILVHRDGRCVFLNEAGARQLGYPNPDLIMGRSVFDFIHPNYHTVVRDRIHAMQTHNKSVGSIEETLIRSDGSTMDVEVSAAPIQYHGQPATMVVVRDLTDRKKAEDALRKADTLSIAGNLAAGVAHEIRNPLTVIKGFIQMSKESETDCSPYASIMLSEVDRIEFIISEFLMLAKPQHVQFQLNSLPEIATHTITLFETQAIMNKVQIISRFAPDLPSVRCEANQMKQVFMNLLKNALESMPDGGHIYVEIDRHNDKNARVRITDEGIGIPPEKLEKLGEPFYTTKEKGTGLGLMVSYNIIKNHRGDIVVYSQPGRTTFEIYLPFSPHI